MYSTPGEVRLALAPVLAASPQDTAAQLTDGQIRDAIREADTRIDTYIGARYAVPVQPLDASADPATYPAQVAVWSRDLAAYGLTLTLYRNRLMEPTNPAFLRYQQVMSDLAAVQKGTAVLDLPPATTGGAGGYAGVINTTPAHLFGLSDFGAPPRPGWAPGWPSGSEVGRYGWS